MPGSPAPGDRRRRSPVDGNLALECGPVSRITTAALQQPVLGLRVGLKSRNAFRSRTPLAPEVAPPRDGARRPVARPWAASWWM